MNQIEINTEHLDTPEKYMEYQEFCSRLLDELNCENWDLSILFCDNRFIQTLNRKYRDIDNPTDVLTFPMDEFAGDRYIAGDIIISIEYSTGVEDPTVETKRLIIHGVLHLLGQDHTYDDDSFENDEMLIKQEALLRKLL